MKPTRRVDILMFDEVEVLDFAGPYEVFTTAARMQARLSPPGAPFEVSTVSRDGGPVRARAGLVVQVDHSFADAPAFDVLLVPGGVVDAALACTDTLTWIARAAPGCEIVASVCTGAFLIAAAGVAGDAPLTTHWEDTAPLRIEPSQPAPAANVQASRLVLEVDPRCRAPLQPGSRASSVPDGCARRSAGRWPCARPPRKATLAIARWQRDNRCNRTPERASRRHMPTPQPSKDCPLLVGSFSQRLPGPGA
jgi:putative intracellular protease/amidase